MKDLTRQLHKLTQLLKPVTKRHMFIATLAVLGFLIYTVYTINAALQQEPDQAYRSQKESQVTQTTFDEETINRIRQLQSSDEAEADLGPRTRNSPFVE